MRTGSLPACRLRKVFGYAAIAVLMCAALAIASTAQTLTTLVSFNGTNGANPSGALLQANDGNFYGTTLYGGAVGSNGCNNTGGCGTVFKVTASGTFSTIYTFCPQANCTDGYFPSGALIQGTDGKIYGTTGGNGQVSSGGTVFRISSNGALTTVYHFCSQGSNCSDGNEPVAGVVEGNDGNLYGTTVRGGAGSACPYSYGCGTVFQMTTSGTLTKLKAFCTQVNCADGLFPQAALVQSAFGSFYGSTQSGGANCPTACGTLFSIDSNGVFAQLVSFNGSNGSNPEAAMVQGVDGNLYGTTAGLPGTVFSLTSTGTLTTLQSLPGSASQATLIQAGDGNFYGTTVSNGGSETLFQITPGGTLTTLYVFCSLSGCADGYQPVAGVIQAIDGNLYGTTYSGGANGLGTVYKFTGPTPRPAALVPVPPCRVFDTRGSSPIQGGTWGTFTVPQLGGCNIPSSAIAYSLNVTLVPPQHHHIGYLTIWPGGRVQPFVSTMNSPDGRTKANAAIVPAGAAGAVSVYVTDTTNVILDIDGYFVPSSGQQVRFFPLTPCRVVDTRQTNFPPGLGAPSFGTGESRELPVLTSPCLQGLPNQPQAYAFNITAVPNPAGQSLNYLTIWPSDQSQPVVSTLNNPTATVVANGAIVPGAVSNGDVSVFTYNSTDVLIDVTGYFGSPGGLALYNTQPCRAYDSRANNGQPFTGERTVNIAGSPCAPPANAAAYVFSATVVPSGSLPFLTLWPDGQMEPIVSTLNAYDGLTTSNLAIVPNTNGSTDADAAQGFTQLILDISGYFAP